ncbi:hypothetical protein KR059_004785, partial [Drosophila kikkawai]
EQQPGESVDDYLHAMQTLAARLKKPKPERHLVKVMKKGLREGIARFVYAMELLTVDELRQESIEVERSFGRRSRTPFPPPATRYPAGERNRVSEVAGPEPDEEEHPPEVEEQPAYLGVDFWRAFGLAPAVVGEIPANGVKKAEEIHAREMEHNADQEDDDEEKVDPESWSLSEAESRKLEEIKLMFLTFEKDGLGTTSLEKHSIELVEGAKSLTYRGFIVGGGRLRMDPGRVAAIRRMPEPRTMKEVRAFLGTAGWYRRFVRNFATLAAPLTEALKKTGNAKFSLSPEAQLAVE